MNVSRIVCAIDTSQVSRAVLAQAFAIAEWENADLHVLQVSGSASEPRTATPVVTARGRAATMIVRHGDPARTIVEYADRARADMIIIGIALPAVDLPQPGWIGETIAREASCATLIVPSGLPYRRDELPFTNVLCPVDFSRASVVAFKRALGLTRRAGGTLTLLHVDDAFGPRSGDDRFLLPEDRRLRMAEARGRLRVATSDQMLKWCHVGIHVTAGAADVHILAEARRIGADLIAMGITLRTSAQPPVFGSIVGRVAAQANSPVLVLKASADSPSWETEYPVPGDDVRLNAGEARNSHVAPDAEPQCVNDYEEQEY